jgi:hypothetical protein
LIRQNSPGDEREKRKALVMKEGQGEQLLLSSCWLSEFSGVWQVRGACDAYQS